MRQRPDPEELERLADEILGAAPLPEDSKALTYEQRMALKARSVAKRAREQDEADISAELDALSALYGADAALAADSGDDARIMRLNRRLAREIRSGQWDEAPSALTSLLMLQVRARLARSNPKYLAAVLGK